jgi:hypothetical protein
MFGLSFSKLLVLAAVIAGVIFFFKMVTKLERARREVARGEARKAAPRKEEGGIGGMFRRARGEKQAAPAEETHEMQACPTCGTYVPARGARDCGRELCPYGA